MKKLTSQWIRRYPVCRRLPLIVLISILSVAAYAQQYQVISVSGFNKDLIANGVGTSGGHQALHTTDTTVDAPNTNGGIHVMYSKNFRGDNNLTSAPDYGLVNNGFIISESDNNKRYQLANFTGSNAIWIVTQNGTGTLTFSTPGCYSALSLLAMSAEGSSSFTATVNFSDATTSDFTFSVPDWYGGSNYAIRGIGRVNRSPDISYGGSHTYDTFDGSSTDPRLYDCAITLTGTALNKLVKSITVV